jgi:hypothetical protein
MTTTDSKYQIHKLRQKWAIYLRYSPGHKGRIYVGVFATREEAEAEIVRLECGGW